MSTVAIPYRPIAPRMWLLRDAPTSERTKEIAFHIQSGDYFATLSTILMLLEDSLADCVARSAIPTTFQISTLHALKDELMHIDRTYTIVPKK